MADNRGSAEEVGPTKLSDAFETLKSTLQDSTKKNKQNVGNDVTRLLGVTGGALIKKYAAVYKSVNVHSKSAFDALFQKYFRHQHVQEHFDELQELEDEWNKSLEIFDYRQGGSTVDEAKVGSTGPLDVTVVDARTEEAVTLSSYLDGTNSILLVLLRHFAWDPWRDHISALQEQVDVIKSLNCKIVVVSFGSAVGVRQWIDASGCTFDVLSDEKREIYSSVGLTKSAVKSWHIEAIKHYAEKIVSEKELPKRFENVDDDPLQMGGDFILDKRGNFALVHRSVKSSLDRPTVDQIIAALRELRSSSL